MRRTAIITDITKVEKIFNKVEKLVDKIVGGDGIRIAVSSAVYTPVEDNCFVMTIKGLWGNKNSEATKEFFKIYLTNAELEIFNTKQIIAVLVTKMVEIIDKSEYDDSSKTLA